MSDFILRNEYPEIMETLFPQLPMEGERVTVKYLNSTNDYVWFSGGKFVNKYGFELYGVMGWKSYSGINDDVSLLAFSFHPSN